MRPDLHAYLGGIVKGINGVPLAIGGIEDHVHLLLGLRATHRLDYVLRDIKADSSGWVQKVVGKKTFEWQSGYLPRIQGRRATRLPLATLCRACGAQLQ